MSKKTSLIGLISERIYSASEEHSNFFRTKEWIVNMSKGDISEIDKLEFILWQLKNYPARYCNNLFMCLSHFWLHFTLADFCKIFENLEHPKLGLSIVEFLYNYLKINSLDILYHSNVSNNHKIIYLDYYKAFTYKLNISTDDIKSLVIEDMGIDLNKLQEEGDMIKKNNGKMKETFQNNYELKRFIIKKLYLLKLKKYFLI